MAMNSLETSQLTLKSIVFLFLFSMALFSYILLGNTYVHYFLIILFFLINVFLVGKSNFSVIIQQKSTWVLFWLWVAFLVTSVISTIYSHSLPLSVASITHLFFAFSFFWMVIGSQRFQVNKDLVLLSVLVQAVILTAIALLLLVFPAYGSLLPGMNLVFSTFGHNHIAAVLILALPISYYFAATEKNKLFWLIPIFLLLGLITSFGRTAIFVCLIQTLIFIFYARKFLTRKHTSSKAFPVLLTIFAVILSSILMIKLLISFGIGANVAYKLCEEEYSVSKLCKDIREEPRPLYWQQALTALKNEPSKGYGLGTFTLINEKWKVNQGDSTSYAHNAYLEMFAETGIVGGVLYFLLFASLLYFSIKVVVQEENPSKKIKLFALLLAVAGMCVNVFFDFDWNFRGVFLLTILFFALILLEKKQPPDSIHSQEVDSVVPKIIMLFPTILAVLFILGSRLIEAGHISAFALIFKDNPQTVLAGMNQLRPNEKLVLLSVYENHPEAYSQLIEKEESVLKKHEYSQKLMEIAPWRGMYVSQAGLLMDSGYFDEAETDLSQRYDFVMEKEARGANTLRYEDKENMADEYIRLANHLYANQMTAKAGKFYQEAYYLEPWVLSRNEPVFIQDADPKKLALFLPSLRTIESQYLNQYRTTYASVFMQLAEHSAIQTPVASVKDDVLSALAIDSGAYWVVKDQFLPLLVTQAQQRRVAGDLVSVKALIDDLNLLINEIKSKSHFSESLYYENDVANLNVYVGNWLATQGSLNTGLYYQQAQQLKPSVLTTTNAAVKVWLEEQEWRDKSIGELAAYAEALTKLDLHDLRATKEHTQMLQYLALHYAEKQENSQAEKTIELMSSINSNDYWVMVQKANWYISVQNFAQADASFKTCLSQAPEHTDCLMGAESLATNSTNQQRFYEVAQIILGEKTYHDFEL